MRASRAAGSSVASWNKAVERAGPGTDADLAEALADAVGADRLAGTPAGQQPRGGALVSGAGVTLADGGQAQDQTGERLG